MGLIYRFGDISLDVDRQELRRGADLVPVEPKVLDLLQFLISNRERVVSKDDLIANVWQGRIVSESTLTSRITAMRQAIGDSGRDQRLVRTIARKGLRFVGEVQEQRGGAEEHVLPPPRVQPEELASKVGSSFFARLDLLGPVKEAAQISSHGETCSDPSRQAVHCGVAVHEHVGRSGPGILRRWPRRGRVDGVVKVQMAFCHLAQVQLHLQGQGR